MACEVVVISRDRITRVGLIDALRLHDREATVSGARSVTDAIQGLASARPTLVVLEAVPGLAESLGQIRQVWPAARLLVVTRLDDRVALRQTLEAGVRGFAVCGGDDLTRLLETVEQVRRGEPAVCAESLEHLIAAFLKDKPNPCTAALTPREREVLVQLASGTSNGEVAAALGISPGTVKRHIGDILSKLEVPSRAAAIALFLGGEGSRRSAR